MVEGTGLENQRRKRPQVRILSFPPSEAFMTVALFCFCGYSYALSMI